MKNHIYCKLFIVVMIMLFAFDISYGVSTEPPFVDILVSHPVGVTNFEAWLELDNMNFTGLSDNQWEISDQAGQSVMIQFFTLNGDPDINTPGFVDLLLSAYTVENNTPVSRGSISLGTDTTSLDLYMSYTNTSGPGGNFDIEYNKNDTGWLNLASITAADYSFDPSPQRQSEIGYLHWQADTSYDYEYTFIPIPEPSTLSLLSLGGLGLWRKKKA